MNNSDRQRWLEKITRALSELKEGTQVIDHANGRELSGRSEEQTTASTKTK